MCAVLKSVEWVVPEAFKIYRKKISWWKAIENYRCEIFKNHFHIFLPVHRLPWIFLAIIKSFFSVQHHAMNIKKAENEFSILFRKIIVKFAHQAINLLLRISGEEIFKNQIFIKPEISKWCVIMYRMWLKFLRNIMHSKLSNWKCNEAMSDELEINLEIIADWKSLQFLMKVH